MDSQCQFCLIKPSIFLHYCLTNPNRKKPLCQAAAIFSQSFYSRVEHHGILNIWTIMLWSFRGKYLLVHVVVLMKCYGKHCSRHILTDTAQIRGEGNRSYWRFSFNKTLINYNSHLKLCFKWVLPFKLIGKDRINIVPARICKKYCISGNAERRKFSFLLEYI